MLAHNQSTDDDNLQLKKHISLLEERVQILEKIVTDEGYDIKQEINGL